MNHEHNDMVILDLDRPRVLRLGHKALKRFSALTGCSMTEMETEIQRYDRMSCLLYVMLSEDDPALTPEQADDLMDRCSIQQLTIACSRAIEAAFDGADAPQEDSPDPPQAAGTGPQA